MFHKKRNFYPGSRLLPLLLFTFCTTFAQEIVLDNYPEEIYKEAKGPESKHYFQNYIAFGVIPDINELSGARINPLFSNEYVFGVRYKRRLLSFYQAGLDLSGRFIQYRIEDEDLAPDASNPFSQYWNVGKQNMRTNSLGLEFYNRLRAGKGNNPGYFLDFGIRGDWHHINKHVIRSKYNTSENPSGKIKTVHRKLMFTNRTTASLTGRIGIKDFIFYGSYRLTDFFNNKYSIPELPRFTFGIQYTI